MNKLPVSVGLDYHQDSVQVAVMNREGQMLANRRCPNNPLAIVTTAEKYGVVVAAAIEACTGAADLADELVLDFGWSVSMAHPGYVSRMKQNPDKSDFSDSRMLADLVRVGYLPRVWIPPQETRELRRLVRYRQQLVNDRRAIKLRVTALLRDYRISNSDAPARRWTKRWLTWISAELPELKGHSRWVLDKQLQRLVLLDQEISEVETRLDDATKDDVVVARLRAQAGIGFITACVMRAEIGRFDRFTRGKQLSRFCGLSPRNASSGPRQADSGLIKAGNEVLRATIIEAAHRLIRWDSRWSQLAGKLRAAGKPSCVIAAAVSNRWVRWLFHQMQPAAIAG